MARPLPSPVSRTESFGSGDLVKDSINTSLCIHVQVNLGFFRCYTLRLLSIFFQLRKLSSPGSAFSYIYRDCACEHTGFTCVCFAFSNLFRADLPQRCPVAVVYDFFSKPGTVLDSEPFTRDLCYHGPEPRTMKKLSWSKH